MKASRIWAFIISLVICLSVTAPAYADASQTKVTVKKGDTVYGICQSLGLDYNICKNTIMRLNGMEKESELSSIKVGSTLIFPASSKDCAESSGKSGDDEVAFYVIPYVMEKGNWIANIYYCWGLDYEDYLDAINSLNDISDLDTIYVGKLLYLPTTKENLQNSNYTTVMEHVMKSGETAYDVCQSYGYDYYDMEDTLVKYNGGADMTKLQAGQKLLIPLM